MLDIVWLFLISNCVYCVFGEDIVDEDCITGQ